MSKKTTNKNQNHQIKITLTPENYKKLEELAREELQDHISGSEL